MTKSNVAIEIFCLWSCCIYFMFLREIEKLPTNKRIILHYDHRLLLILSTPCLLCQETFRSCADVSIEERTSNKWKSESEKMQLMKKLYLILLKREKVNNKIYNLCFFFILYLFLQEKSSLLTRLKLLKLKREMIIKRSSFENEKSQSQKKTNGRSGARNLKFHNLHLKR